MKSIALKYKILPLLFFIIFSMKAQNEEDALRYSNVFFGGTARYMGVGGAFGALGADISVLNINPAGMARFKKSEISLTPNISLTNANSTFGGNSTSSGKEKLNVGSFGLVGVTKRKPENNSKWAAIQLGFSYNRLADFNERFQISGDNNHSMSHVFALRSNNYSPDQLSDADPFYGELAYQTYITDFDTNSNTYQSRMNSQLINHDHEVTRRGRVGEYALAMAGNYNQKLYIGASIGLPKVVFEETKQHTELEVQDSSDFTHSFTFNEYQLTTGNGINGKIGLIYLPLKWLRFGVALHTGTYYNLNDYWNTSMSSVVSTNESYNSSSIDGIYNYKLRTPSKLITSASIVVAKAALISVDYSRIDHSLSRLSPNTFYGDNYNFETENSTIDSNYNITNNLQVGAEIKLGKFYLLRAGYANFQSPNNENTLNRIAYSGGLGYRNKKYFIDLGCRYSFWKDNYYMYDPAIIENSSTENSMLNISVTIGMKW
jgi:hypothetical protein